MRGIPQNTWQKCLTEDDWNFGQIERVTFKEHEWPQCLSWELAREKKQADNGGCFPSSRLDLPAYITRRKKENWKRLLKSDSINRSMWIALDWHTLYRHWREDVENAATNLPAPPVMDGDGRTEIVPFKIPWDWRDDEIKIAFDQWLKLNRPRGESSFNVYPWGEKVHWVDDRPRIDEPSKPKIKSGAGSYIRQVKKLLKQLAAWRLIQRYKGDNFDAYDHPGGGKYLGKSYNHPSEWTEARKSVQAALKDIWRIQREAENFASTKTG